MRYTVGLDLGQANDWTAISVIERNGDTLDLRHLDRPQIGTPYPAIVERVRTLMLTPPLLRACILVVDDTGVGRAVSDLFRAAGCPLKAITITGSKEATQDEKQPWRWNVPKRDLVMTLVSLVHQRRLRIAAGLELAPVLSQEMQNFRMKISAGDRPHDSYEHWREGDHDDLLLSAALAAWWAVRYRPLDELLPGMRAGELRRESADAGRL